MLSAIPAHAAPDRSSPEFAADTADAPDRRSAREYVDDAAVAASNRDDRNASRHRIATKIWHRLPALLGAAAYVTASRFAGDHAAREMAIEGGAIALGSAGYALAYQPATSVGPGLPRAALGVKEVFYTALGLGAGAALGALTPDGSQRGAVAVEGAVFSIAMLAGDW